MANPKFNAKKGLSVGGALGATPIDVIDDTGKFTPQVIVASQGMYENTNTITINYTIGTGNNAMSSGPVSIAPGASVTIPVGSYWKVI